MPQFKAHQVWPTPIFETEIPVKAEWVQFCNEAPNKRTNDNNGYISIDKPILEYNEMSELRELIYQQAHVYLKHHLHIKNKFKFTSSWVTIHDYNDYAQIHSHKNSVISGVYYLQTTDNCGDLIFNRDNFLSETFMFDLEETTVVNSFKYKIPVETGKLLLFPSNIKHGTPKMNVHNFRRIAISFNMFPTGTIGDEDVLLQT